MKKKGDSFCNSSTEDEYFDSHTTYTSSEGNVIKVSNICLLLQPCKHSVMINGVWTDMNSIEIANWFIDNDMDVPLHFRQSLRPVNINLLNRV
jgi:hypothetical protein